MKKILTVIGTRPQYIKLDKNLDQIILDTNQHYSNGLQNDLFFKELGLPKPDYELGETKLPNMIKKIISVIKKEKPDIVQVFGDTRSTLAGAIAAHEMNVPIAHVEAGMRCGRRDMPEERIRIIVDHMSAWLFCPTITAMKNLEEERIRENVFLSGNVMFDTFSACCPVAKRKDHGTYSYLSIHRQETVESKVRLEGIMEGVAGDEKIIFPAHPRTVKQLELFKIAIPKNVKIIKPMKYKDNINLISGARRVLTDSGGVQNEAYWMLIPCGILRPETK